MNAIFFTNNLRISIFCSTFAPAFEKQSKFYASTMCLVLGKMLPANFATLAQLVEQRIRNA